MPFSPSMLNQMKQGGTKETDPLAELRAQFNLTPPADAGQQQGPVDERDLAEKSRTFYDPNFTNIQRYQEANQGQGQREADALAGDVRQQGSVFQTHLDDAATKFNSGANSDKGPGFTYADGDGPNSGRGGGSVASRGGGAPVGGGGTPGSVNPSSYAYAAGSYGGAGSLLEQSPELAGEAKKVGDAANQLNNDAGRAQSLKDLYGKNSSYYGTGSSGLDAFLSGNEGHGTLAGVQKEYGGLEDLLKTKNDESIDQVSLRKTRDRNAASARAATKQRAGAEQMPGEQLLALQQQTQEDTRTDEWLNKIEEEAGTENDVLGMDFGGSYEAKNLWVQARKTGDWSKVEAYVNKKYGADVGREFKNAIDDSAGRKQRKEQFNSASPGRFGPATYDPTKDLTNGAVTWGANYLADEQRKRNGGYWAPDWTLTPPV